MNYESHKRLDSWTIHLKQIFSKKHLMQFKYSSKCFSNSIHWFTYLGSQLLLKSSLINSVIPQFSNFFSQTENTDILEPLLSGAAFLLIIIQVYLIESLQWRSISAGNIVSRPFCPHWLNSTQNPHIFWSVKDSVTKVNFF